MVSFLRVYLPKTRTHVFSRPIVSHVQPISLFSIWSPSYYFWRRQHNKELYALYFSPHIIWMIKSRGLKWAGHAGRMRKSKDAYRVLVGKSERRRPLGRPRRRWEDNIKMDLREVGLGGGGMDWIDQAQDRDRWWALANTVMNLRVS
jgi:hypothetical protein